MSIRTILRLRLRHGYFDDEPPPLRAEPAAEARRAIAAAGLRVRVEPGETIVHGAADPPAALSFALRADDPVLSPLSPSLAAGDPRRGPARLRLIAAQSGGAVDAAAAISGWAEWRADDPLAWLDVDLSNAGGDGPAAEITLTVPMVETFVVYHVIGAAAQNGYAVVYPAGGDAFEALGPTSLPDGRTALSFRSTTSAPLTRTGSRALLIQTEKTTVRTVISTLPVPSPVVSRVMGADGVERLHSDVYVSV